MRQVKTGAIMKVSFPLIALTLLCLSSQAAPKAPLTSIRLGILESFSISETPSIERMRSAYESALYFAIGENERRLSSCGYSFRVSTEYYDNADRLAPKERATYLENSGVFLILGPRRSEQYLVATHGVVRTPIISTTASADEVQKLPAPFFTMYPSIDEFATALIRATDKEKYGKRYGSLSDVTCRACRDMSLKFEERAKAKGYSKEFDLEIAGEKPSLVPLVQALREKTIDFLFLPVYSKTAGFIIASLQKEFPTIKYVGTHNWGDGAYGLLEDYRILPNVKAISINGNASPELMGDEFGVRSLDREGKAGVIGPPASAYRVVDFVRILTDDLCREHQQKRQLKSKEDFLAFFKTLPAKHFQKNAVMGIFRIENGEYQFGYRVRAK